MSGGRFRPAVLGVAVVLLFCSSPGKNTITW
jgi:hypothetical protein